MHQKNISPGFTIWGLDMYSMLILLPHRDGYCVGADVNPWSLMSAFCFGSHLCFVLGLPSHDLDVGNTEDFNSSGRVLNSSKHDPPRP